MGVYILTFDLKDPARETDLREYVTKKLGGTLITSNTYVMETDKAPAAIMDDVVWIANEKVTVYIFTITKPRSGFGPKNKNALLNTLLP